MKPSLEVAHCPSCQAQAQGDFCSRCGEAIATHAPSAREFVHEFIGHYVALEGKLWQTLRLLVFKPGQLTVDFLRGRRVPYINPLRLYLSLSLVMFALIKVYGVDLPQLTMDNKSFGVAYSHSGVNPGPPGKIATATLSLQAQELSNKDFEAIHQTLALVERVSSAWADNARQFTTMPPAAKAEVLNHGFLANLPYMLIGALPLFALYLKLIHARTGRRYGEHLVFALHVSGFAFLLASVMILVPGNLCWLLAALYSGLYALITPWDWIQLLPIAWGMAYLPSAIRRVYGGSRPAAWGKSVVLALVHLSVIAGLMIGAEVLAVFRHA